MFPVNRSTDDLFDLFRDFDALFRKTFGGWRELPAHGERPFGLLPMPLMGRAGFTPAVAWSARGGMVQIRVELPGVDPEDVTVDVAGNRLYIRGEKKLEDKLNEKDIHYRETAHGKFERSFALPEGVKADDVKATFNNGVLDLALPEGRQVTRKIPIQLGPKGTKEIKAA